MAVLEMTRYHDRHELIFVDDASRDNTLCVIREIERAFPQTPMSVLAHERNTGRGRTVTDGMLAARGRIVGFLDIDLETPAHYIPAAVLAIERGADVAVARRTYKFLWRSVLRQAMSVGYHALEARTLQVPLNDTEAGFKFFNRERVLQVLRECKDPGWFWDTEIMVRSYFSGLRIIEIPTLFLKRYDKPSTVRPLHDTVDYLRKLARFRKEAEVLRRHYHGRGCVPVPVATIR
jgi:glycosyltransferase involved in cell wall biosynthesis